MSSERVDIWVSFFDTLNIGWVVEPTFKGRGLSENEKHYNLNVVAGWQTFRHLYAHTWSQRIVMEPYIGIWGEQDFSG